MTIALSDELRRGFLNRVSVLEGHLTELVGTLGGSRQGVVRALRLMLQFPRAARTVLEAEWSTNTDALSRVELTRHYLQHVNSVAALAEDWFSRGVDVGIPSDLMKAVERECELLLGKRDAVLAVGSSDNFETFVANLREEIFGPLGPLCPQLPPEFQESSFAMMRIPRLEGLQALWRPLVIGHELAHIAVAEKDSLEAMDLARKFDWDTAAQLNIPPFAAHLGLQPSLAVYRAAELWAEEVLCDAYAVRRFGAAGVAAMSSFLETVGATADTGDHPPGWTRVRLQTGWLGSEIPESLKEVLQPWIDLAATARPNISEDWAVFLMDWLEEIADAFNDAISDWPAAYDSSKRVELIGYVSDHLAQGIPVSEKLRPEGSAEPIEDPDILNGGWIGWAKSFDVPVQRLVAKALESREFLRRWHESGGELATLTSPSGEDVSDATSVLSSEEIARRLWSQDADRIIVTPLVPEWGAGASLDLRLGNRFIVFQRTRTGSFDPLRQEHDPRSMQALVEREWGDSFVLHPNELVLASTLEYLVLPADVAGQVLARSSYGRLGLMTATAVLAHPHFHGCLTLELVNLGVVPIELTPGERIAQMMFIAWNHRRPSRPKNMRFPRGQSFQGSETIRIQRFSRRCDDFARVIERLHT